MELEASSLLS